MARNRMINVSFFGDLKLAKVSRSARLLFAGTWVHSDDHSVCEAHPSTLKANIFPHDDILIFHKDGEESVEGLLQQLIDAGVVLPFTVRDTPYIYIKNFLLYQKIDRPSKRRHPSPPEEYIVEHSSSDTRGLPEDSTRPRPSKYKSKSKRQRQLSNGNKQQAINKPKGKNKHNGKKSCKKNTSQQVAPDKFSDAGRLADFLLEKIKINNPNARDPNFKTWAIEIDRMIRIDKRDPDAVETAIVWSQDHDFWSGVVLSPQKLRKHFDQMEVQARQAEQLHQAGGKAGLRRKQNIQDALDNLDRKENEGKTGGLCLE